MNEPVTVGQFAGYIIGAMIGFPIGWYLIPYLLKGRNK